MECHKDFIIHELLHHTVPNHVSLKLAREQKLCDPYSTLKIPASPYLPGCTSYISQSSSTIVLSVYHLPPSSSFSGNKTAVSFFTRSYSYKSKIVEDRSSSLCLKVSKCPVLHYRISTYRGKTIKVTLKYP